MTTTKPGTTRGRKLRTGAAGVALLGAVTGIGTAYVGTGAAQAAETHSYPAKVDINGRQKIGQDADAPGHIENQYKKGEQVPVTCQAGHDGALWDKTADKTWVPDAYVKTGTDGRVSGVPTCAEDDGSGVKVHGRNNGPAGPTTGTRAQKIQRVIAAAKSQTGKGLNYSWGAGGKGGPAYGSTELSPSGHDDSNSYGFDCSGLTLYAYWKGAGLDIGSYSGAQMAKGTKVSINSLKPSDLVYKGSSESNTDHVAIYIGAGKIVQASPDPRSNGVRVDTFDKSAGWLSHGTRPLT